MLRRVFPPVSSILRRRCEYNILLDLCWGASRAMSLQDLQDGLGLGRGLGLFGVFESYALFGTSERPTTFALQRDLGVMSGSIGRILLFMTYVPVEKTRALRRFLVDFLPLSLCCHIVLLWVTETLVSAKLSTSC